MVSSSGHPDDRVGGYRFTPANLRVSPPPLLWVLQSRLSAKLPMNSLIYRLVCAISGLMFVCVCSAPEKWDWIRENYNLA